MTVNRSRESDFAEAARQPQSSAFVEFLGLLRQNKKWWLAPIVIVLTLVTLMVILASSSAAPLIYTTW